MSLRLRLFGRPAIASDAPAADLPAERPHQVFVHLAARRQWVARAEVASLLWPDLPPALANANVRKVLLRLRALPWGAVLQAQGHALRVEVATDVHDFERALAEYRHADALRLYTGAFLEGFDDAGSEAWATWLGYERARLQGAWRTAAIVHLGTPGLAPAGIHALASRLLAADPLDEDAVHATMSAFQAAGEVTAARSLFRDYAQRLERELGLAPGAHLQALHDGAQPSPLPARSVPADDGFVGRTLEMRRIGELLAEGRRLVCLVGPGGAGKTRLARQVMAQPRDGASPVVFVPLEDVADPGGIGPAIAGALGLRLAHGDGMPQVIDALRERRLLLVLDNFEHLAAGAALVAGLLDACPSVQAIVTSRARLGLRDEWVVSVDGLPCPDDDDADRAIAFDAVRLFVQAAQRTNAGFDPAAERTGLVALCRHVQGLPLALELAAAWTRGLSCEAIARELLDDATLLGTTDPTRPARHAHMDAVFEHSWKLLVPAEQEALARLSVFRGGCRIEAARAVTGAPLPVIGALADKSLLHREGDRIALHPLVQQQAQRRLAPASMAQAAAAHARWYHHWLDQLGPEAEEGRGNAMARIAIDFENCRAAWRWAVEEGHGPWLAASSGTLRYFAHQHGRVPEIHELLSQALAGPAQGDPRVLATLAHVEYLLDRYPQAMSCAQRAIDALPDGDGLDAASRLRAYSTLGSCHMRLGDYGEAARCYRAALDDAERAGKPASRAAMSSNLSRVALRRGRLDEALAMSQQALAQFRLLGHVADEALGLNNMAAICQAMGDGPATLAHLREALQLCERHGLKRTGTMVLGNLAQVLEERGETEEALGYALRCLEHARAMHDRPQEATMRRVLASLAARQGDVATARNEFRHAAELALALGGAELQLEVLVGFGELLVAQGQPIAAAALLDGLEDPASAIVTCKQAIERMRERHELPRSGGRPAADVPSLLRRVVEETPQSHRTLATSLSNR